MQDDYILNAGDQIVFVFQGGRNDVLTRFVENDGNIYLDFTTPISALGRKFKEVKNEIYSRVKSSLTETNVYLSLGSINKVTVTITGEVNIPGVYNLDPFSTVLDALMVAGGVRKSGTLRNVKLIENDQVSNVDLYEFLFGIQPSKKKIF